MTKPTFDYELSGDHVVVHIKGLSSPINIAGLNHLPPEKIEKKILYELKVLQTQKQCDQLNRAIASVETLNLIVELRSHAKKEAKTPPALAQTIMILLGPEKTTNTILGDFQEIFNNDLATHDSETARRNYWIRVAREVLPLIYSRMKSSAIIAFLLDYGRRKLGL